MTSEPPPPDMTLTRSSRDQDAMAATLTPWIAAQLPEGADPEVALSGASDANGMSSETILADITWTEDGVRTTQPFVMRMAPAEADVPVFQSYRLDHQYEAIRLVGELTDVPVPTPRWLEAMTIRAACSRAASSWIARAGERSGTARCWTRRACGTLSAACWSAASASSRSGSP